MIESQHMAELMGEDGDQLLLVPVEVDSVDLDVGLGRLAVVWASRNEAGEQMRDRIATPVIAVGVLGDSSRTPTLMLHGEEALVVGAHNTACRSEWADLQPRGREIRECSIPRCGGTLPSVP